MKVWEAIHLQNKSVSTTLNKSSKGQFPVSGPLQDAMKFLVQQLITMCCMMLLSKK